MIPDKAADSCVSFTNNSVFESKTVWRLFYSPFQVGKLHSVEYNNHNIEADISLDSYKIMHTYIR